MNYQWLLVILLLVLGCLVAEVPRVSPLSYFFMMLAALLAKGLIR